MSLTIKASLYRGWNRDPIETRRFSIDQEVATSFTYLTQKLAQIFPDLEADKIHITYIDSDGDRVSISTDDELTEALSQFDGSIFRIRLKKKCEREREDAFHHGGHYHGGHHHGGHHHGGHHQLPPWFNFLNSYMKGSGNPFESFFQQQQQQEPAAEQKEEEQEEGTKEEPTTKEGEGATPNPQPGDKRGPYHPGVICDGCSGSIYGKRFKCCQCPDYDLCEGCEGKGLHTDHDMYTIDKPAGRPWGGPWRGHGQLGPFEFKWWGHPGRCGAGRNPWANGWPQSGQCSWGWQDCNGPCSNTTNSEQQPQTEANTGGSGGVEEKMDTTPQETNEPLNVETQEENEKTEEQ